VGDKTISPATNSYLVAEEKPGVRKYPLLKIDSEGV